MRIFFLISLMILSCLSPAFAQTNDAIFPQAAIKWKDCPLSVLIADYQNMSGKRIEVVKGIDLTGKVSLEWQGSASNYFTMIEAVLRTNNIELFQITSNRIVATWVDPDIAPRGFQSTDLPAPYASYIERLRQRRTEARIKAEHEEPGITGEELEEHLQKYNMELIRKAAHGEATEPPLPIPLTPEQDTILVKEGVLPPADTRDSKQEKDN